jgi:hypothetical protein
VLGEHVAIENVYLGDCSLGHEIEDVGAGAAKPSNANPQAGKLGIDDADPGAARCRVDIFEDAVLLLGRDDWEHASGSIGIELDRFPRNAADVGRHLVMVVAVVCLRRKGEIRAQAGSEVLRCRSILDGGNFSAICVTRMRAGPIANVVVGLFGDVTGQLKLRDEDAPAYHALRFDKRDVSDQQEAVPDVEIVAFVLQS